MALHRLRTSTPIAAIAGMLGAAVLAAALAAPDADAARGDKKRRKNSRPDAGPDSAAVDASPLSRVDSGQTPDATRQPPSSVAPYPSSGLVCLYGKAHEDGGERCLSPEELDPPRLIVVDTRALAEKLGMLRPASTDAPDDGGAPDAGGDGDVDDDMASGSDGLYRARVVRVQFENGAVGGAMRSLKNVRRDLADCAEDNGGLRAESARLKLLFYVRADGRASGVTVASARNIPPAVLRCVTKLLEGSPMGRPSTNPVGVKALIELKENEKD